VRWQRWQPLIQGLARRFAQSARRVGLLREDLEQESYLIFCRADGSYSSSHGAPEEAYWYVVFTRGFISLIRRRPLLLLGELDRLVAGRQADPVSWLEDALEAIVRRDSKKKLKVRAFRLHHLEGRKLAELSDALGRSLSSLSRYCTFRDNVPTQLSL
jgi:DNA-directed RNA polymerase specialized sigma24 family protein